MADNLKQTVTAGKQLAKAHRLQSAQGFATKFGIGVGTRVGNYRMGLVAEATLEEIGSAAVRKMRFTV
ncbi:hypothetical protein E4U30_003153 [Claviceps sp. LM220 group G6]|nr:hypothetical protein E4U30_003153 [Claviceps sp. LM220 group G6]KAG6119326.1 hypothetical protein E4U14_005531 [Claviceps sp. LM454 group G7]